MKTHINNSVRRIQNALVLSHQRAVLIRQSVCNHVARDTQHRDAESYRAHQGYSLARVLGFAIVMASLVVSAHAKGGSHSYGSHSHKAHKPHATSSPVGTNPKKH